MKLLLLHGWGFDAHLWDGLLQHLTGFEVVRWDRGYFGEFREDYVKGSMIAIGHSLGSMLLNDLLPPDVPLVAINGFDRFTGPRALPEETLQQMCNAFARRPKAVLTGFRAACGAGPAPERINRSRLAIDLAWLATKTHCLPRERTLVLHGANDPILPEHMRDCVFEGAWRYTHLAGGHVLPLVDPKWCAAQIRSFACQ